MSKFSENSSGTLPVFMLAGVFLILALLMRLISHFYSSANEPVVGEDVEIKKEQGLTVQRPQRKLDISRRQLDLDKTGNVFDDIHTNYSTYEVKTETLKRDEVPYYPFNPVQGKTESKIKITLFFDSSCASCRTSIQYFLNTIAPYKKDVLLVYKFMPVNKKESEGGVFDQIAWRADKFSEYMQNLLRRNTVMETEEYMDLLERVGIPLKQQQKVMQDYMQDIIAVNQNDIVLAEDLGLYKRGHNPVYYINGYRLGQSLLPENEINTYIERLKKGQHIISEF